MLTSDLFSFPRYGLSVSTGNLLIFACSLLQLFFIFQIRCPFNLGKLVFNLIEVFLHERKFFYGNIRSILNLFQETGCCIKSYLVSISLQVWWLLS